MKSALNDNWILQCVSNIQYTAELKFTFANNIHCNISIFAQTNILWSENVNDCEHYLYFSISYAIIYFHYIYNEFVFILLGIIKYFLFFFNPNLASSIEESHGITNRYNNNKNHLS